MTESALRPKRDELLTRLGDLVSVYGTSREASMTQAMELLSLVQRLRREAARRGDSELALRRSAASDFVALSRCTAHATAPPPSSVMNSRRTIIRSPRRRGRAASAGFPGRAP